MLNVIPDNYLKIGTIIIGIITLLIEFFLLMKKRTPIIKGIKYFCYLLTLLLVGVYSFGIYYLNKTVNFIDNITIMNEEVTNYYIAVLKGTKYQETSDFKTHLKKY